MTGVLSSRRRASSALALAAVLLLAACGGGHGSAAPAGGTLPAEDAADISSTTATPEPPTTIARPLAGTLPAPGATTTAAPPTSAPPTAAPVTTPARTAPTTTAARPATTLPTPAPVPPARAVEPRIVLGRIDIPKLGVSMDLLEGITLSTLDQGPGHWPGTAMPGQPGNVVVAGHRVSHTKPFRNIDKLVAGDQVIFTIDGVRTTYVVTGSEVVPPTAVQIVAQTPEPTATLFACHPPGSTRFRWVTHLKLQA